MSRNSQKLKRSWRTSELVFEGKAKQRPWQLILLLLVIGGCIPFCQAQIWTTLYQQMSAPYPGNHPSTGVHVPQKCPNGQVQYDTELDGSGNGYVIHGIWKCTGTIVYRHSYKNWILDGDYINDTPAARGVFSNGVPDSITFTPYGGGTDQTVSFPGGTGPWIVPAVGGCGPFQAGVPLPLDEEGYLVAGKQEGLWIMHHCGKKEAELFYHNGKLDGVAKQYQDNRLWMMLTMKDGVPDGPFSYDRSPFDLTLPRFDGVNCAGASFARAFGPDPYGNALDFGVGKLCGVWHFYNQSGSVLATEDFTSGTGHFVSYRLDGDLLFEGDVANGLAQGTWTRFDIYGRPDLAFVMKDGIVQTQVQMPHAPAKP